MERSPEALVYNLGRVGKMERRGAVVLAVVGEFQEL